LSLLSALYGHHLRNSCRLALNQGPFLNIWQAYLISLSVLSFSNSYANPGRIRCSKFSCS
jgi:hypothetical protein